MNSIACLAANSSLPPANEATCICVSALSVFSDYKKEFPIRFNSTSTAATARASSKRSSTIQADFGITQLPVDEKRLQAVKIHSDEIKLLVPAPIIRSPRAKPPASAKDVTPLRPLLLPKSGTTRNRLNAWLEPVEDSIQISMELDSTEMIKRFVMGGPRIVLSRRLQLPGRGHCWQARHTFSLAPEPMIRRLGLIYRKDKALSKAALGFIQIVLDNVGEESGTAKEKPKPPRVVA